MLDSFWNMILDPKMKQLVMKSLRVAAHITGNSIISQTAFPD